jgi:hypothetical protein
MRRTPRPGGFARQPQVRELIDFSQPVALLLLGVLYFITDGEGPGQLIGAYRDSLPPGSYLALSHGCADEVPTDVIAGTAAAYDQATAPLVLRNRAQISRFFDGFEPVDPGLVYLPLWRPDGSPRICRRRRGPACSAGSDARAAEGRPRFPRGPAVRAGP